MAQTYPNHGRIDGPIVIIGFGSIGQGTLPLIERHFTYDPHRVHVIEPSDEHRTFLEQRGVHFIHHAVTPENYRALLTQLFPDGRGFCVNLSVDTSSLELMRLCRELGVLYVDTVVEPWAGHYFDLSLTPADRTNYALREAVRAEERANPGGPTAVSCCGANPGMVSWLLKEALLRLAADTGGRADGAGGPRRLGAADARRSGSRACTSPSATPRPGATPSRSAASSTPGRSRASSPRASSRPSSAGGRTRRWFPPNGHRQPKGCKAAIYLDTPGHADQGPHLDARGRAAVRLSRHPQRGDLDCRLLHGRRGRRRRSSGRPATMPTTRATRRCCRCTRCSAPARCRTP